MEWNCLNMTTKKKPSRTDILVIHTHHNLGKYLGLTTSRRFSKWYVPALLSLFVVCAAYKIRERVIMYTSMSNVRYLTITLDAINFATNLIYIGISLLGSLLGRRKWEKLFAALGSAEELLPTNFFIDKSVRRFKLITAIYHLILLACYSCNALHLILRNLRYTLRFSVTLRIAIYFGTFDVISVYLFNEAVRKRYAHLVKMILSSTIRDGSVEVILKNEEEKGRVQKLRKVFSIHKTLYACVEQLNDIFGWKIYLVLQNVVVSLLSTFNSVVLFLKDQHLVPWKEEIIYSTVFSAVFAVSVFLNYSTLSEGSSFPLTISPI